MDALDLKFSTLVATAPRVADKAAQAALARAGLDLIDNALADDKEAEAVRAIPLIEAAARKVQDPALLAAALAQGPRVRVAATLRRDPDEPNANTIEGRWQCLNKGDWAKGLPMLAKGADAELKALATKELAAKGSSPAPAAISLADAWWDYGQKQGEPAKAAAQRHAGEWYAIARPGLRGLDAARADARTPKGSGPVLPPPPAAGVPPVAGSPSGPALTLAPNPSGKLVLLHAIEGHGGPIVELQFAAGGRLLRSGAWASGGSDVCRVWSVGEGNLLYQVEGAYGALSPDGQALLEGKSLYAVESKKLIREFTPAPAYGVIYGHAFSSNGARFAVTRQLGKDETGKARPCTLSVGDTKTGIVTQEMGDWPLNGIPHSAAFAPDGRHVVVSFGNLRHPIELWDVDAGKAIWDAEVGGVAHQASFSADGSRVYTLPSNENKTVCVLDAGTGKILASLKHEKHVNTVDLSPDNRLALTGSEDPASGLKLWDVETAKDLGRFDAKQPCGGATFTAAGRRVLAGFADGTVRLYDTQTGKELDSEGGHTGPVKVVAVSADGRLAASGGEDKTVRVWRMPEFDAAPHAGESAGPTPPAPSSSQSPAPIIATPLDLPTKPGLIRRFPWPQTGTKSIQITPDLRRILCAHKDGSGPAILWDTQTGQPVDFGKGAITGFATQFCRILPDGKRLLLKRAHTWVLIDVQTGKDLLVLGENLGWRATFSIDGSRLLVYDGDTGLATVTDVKDPPQTRRFEKLAPVGEGLHFSNDGRTIVGIPMWADFVMHAWDADTGVELFHLKTDGGCDGLAFSRDGKFLLQVNHGPGTFLRDAKTGQVVLECKDTNWDTESVLSSNNRFIVVGYHEAPHGVGLFDLASADHGKVQPMAPFRGAMGFGVHAIALSSDDHRLLAACKDKSLRLFDLQAGVLLNKFDQEGEATACAFSADGRCAVSADDQAVYLWRLPDPATRK